MLAAPPRTHAFGRAVLAAGLASIVGVAACGGSAPPAGVPGAGPPVQSQPGAPAPEAEQGYGQQPSGGAAPSPAPTQPTDQRFAEPPAEPIGPSDLPAEVALKEAQSDFDRAESELSSAGRDCALACKALGSMQRATERICSLSPETAADGRCRRARERLGAAQGRVQRGCKC